MDAPRPAIPGLVDLTVLARGGYATVYRAIQESVGREVAVKVENRALADREDRIRYLREARAAGRMSGHPHVVDLFDAGLSVDGRPYLIMDLCQGSYAELCRVRPLTAVQAWAVGVKIADALADAHSLGILHRDVKPGNVLLTRFGEPVLADFGLAVLAETREWPVGFDALTPAYAPPEAFGHWGESGAKGDVYALAATLYAMIGGRPPRWSEDQSPSLLVVPDTFVAAVADLPGVPPDFMALLQAGLASDPAARPTAEQLRDDLLGLRMELIVAPSVEPVPADAVPMVGLTTDLAVLPLRLAQTRSDGDSSTVRYPSPSPAVLSAAREVRPLPGARGPDAASPDALSSDGELVSDGACPSGCELMSDGACPSGGELVSDGACPSGCELVSDGACPSGGEVALAETPARGAALRWWKALIWSADALVLLGTVAAWYVVAGPIVRPQRGPTGNVVSAGRYIVTGRACGSGVSVAGVRCPSEAECYDEILVTDGVADAGRLECAGPHTWEAFVVGTLPEELAGRAYPLIHAAAEVRETCGATTLSALAGVDPAGWEFEVLLPSPEALHAGERTYRCLAGRGVNALPGTEPAHPSG